jgi:hypothetical protein
MLLLIAQRLFELLDLAIRAGEGATDTCRLRTGSLGIRSRCSGSAGSLSCGS